MPAPTIDPTTSVLGYKQWEYWQYQPYATDSSFLPVVLWEAKGLPDGMTIDAPTLYIATTGAASTDIITATGSAFANGDKVYFTALTGGAGLAVNTRYYVVNVSGATFKLALTSGGTAIDFTTDITAATISKVSTGLISGAATVPGVFVVELKATNAEGTGRLIVPIGITPQAGSNSFYPDVEIDVVTREVLWPGCVIKLHDALILRVAFKNSGSYIDMDLTGLRMVLKQEETESILVKGNTFAKVGAGTAARYLLYIPASDAAFAAALADSEDNIPLDAASGLSTTGFPALAEISWTVNNASGISGSPTTLNQSSKTFLIEAERDLEPTQA
ncbi:MAG: hypothetical protein ABIT76_08580 [Chthoniobacterales bacterium]